MSWAARELGLLPRLVRLLSGQWSAVVVVSVVLVASAWSRQVEADWAAKRQWMERPVDVGLVASVV